MMLNKPKPKRDDEANLIPLINIVFLLLIFFMLAGSFTQPDLFKVVTPTSSIQQVPEDKTLIILISANGRLAIDDEEIELSVLTSRVSEGRVGEPELRVQLKADASLNAEDLLDVMESVKAAGITQLSLLTVMGGS